jgi:hypothetical protein
MRVGLSFPLPWPASKNAAKQLISQDFVVGKTESTIGNTKPMFHNLGSNPLRVEPTRSGVILVNSL